MHGSFVAGKEVKTEIFQKFNTPACYLTLLSVSSFTVATILGMNQVMMTTLQQLFNLTSKQMGMLIYMLTFTDQNY